MNNKNVVHVPYKQLPPEAVALFFFEAMGAWGRNHHCRPTLPELTPTLEAVWDENHLTTQDLRDFHRMKSLIAGHFDRSVAVPEKAATHCGD